MVRVFLSRAYVTRLCERALLRSVAIKRPNRTREIDVRDIVFEMIYTREYYDCRLSYRGRINLP